ncbi:hypothetical protein KSC_001810 [Ktedonobacter sp. SOSP1-52]|uniref:maleylpyruvate isomerase N-terminal domain-containing protein n=1 Tax=Ktedonobacter sp. SOSP1-52 TaxID=2778366 RepID=UPI001916717B|nr:maleylpyruvate isomerase N-terminal domain-containing protein [Ktedonobacter sp. SOSP1-52]GHO61289.1 hypothetical protein KSC_001810 [Ktedonobacter sp. SOSP1-52]
MMERGYTAFEAFLAPLSEAQLTESGVSGDWSLKDILVHLATDKGALLRFLKKCCASLLRVALIIWHYLSEGRSLPIS